MFLGAKEPNVVEYRISGTQTETLRRAAETLITSIRPIGGYATLQHNWDNKILTVLIKVDQARARRAGVTSVDIAVSLNNFFSGTKVSDFRERDQSIPIVLRGERRQRETLDR